MDTITLKTQAGQEIEVPVVFAFDPDGKPAELVGDVEPENCDHAGAGRSSNLDMRCSRCVSRLFLPAPFLAKRSEEELGAMYAAWCAAGWPEFIGGKDAHWNVSADQWTLFDLPAFAQVGGLPVRRDKLATFAGGAL